MKSLWLWNFMDFAHGQIYTSGSPDMEWPSSLLQFGSKVVAVRLDYQILLKSPLPPNITGWILPWGNMNAGREKPITSQVTHVWH